MAISTHAGKDTGGGVLEVNQNVAGVALLGIGQKIDVITLLVTCAQKAHHRSTNRECVAWQAPSVPTSLRQFKYS
jgi:hypothetical protein